ncbi:MAG: glycosyltransferase family 4 protein [Kiritimatiellae bacterium]|nr:glycosyltransferase family 4 protein [Kiritimatiellia bacterium]
MSFYPLRFAPKAAHRRAAVPATPPPPPPKVCILAPSYWPAVGGGETHARLLARELSARGCAVTVLTSRREADWASEEKFEGSRILRFGRPGHVRLGKYLLLGPALGWLVANRRRWDVVYVCGLRVAGWGGVLAQLLARKPCILRAEAMGEMDGAFIWRSPEGAVSARKRALARPFIALRNALYRRAAAFLAVSTPVRDEYRECGIPDEKIALLPNGYDPARFRPLADPAAKTELRRRLGLPEDPARPVFAYSGKLIRGKGLGFLLRVWKSFHAMRPAAVLLLIGSGGAQSLSCEDDLRRYAAENGLGKSVRFTGYTDDVVSWLQASDAFVFASERESQGLAVLEAMACGLPVLASDIPGVRDMVRDGIDGHLLPPRGEIAWLHAMEDLLDHPAAARAVAAAAAETALTRYAIGTVADRHIDLFRRLLAPH